MILYNGLTLAYIGDAYYEMLVRDYCLNQGFTLVNDLHNLAVKYTNSVSQAFAAKALYDEFYTEDEKKIYKRGRNQNSTHKPKNADIQTYNSSTGFEAVIGYLYLEKSYSRIKEIFSFTISLIDKKNVDNKVI